MKCDVCNQERETTWFPDRTGLLRAMCGECATVHASPDELRTIALAERDAAVAVVEALVGAFGREMARGFSSTEQQIALYRARALLVQHGKAVT